MRRVVTWWGDRWHATPWIALGIYVLVCGIVLRAWWAVFGPMAAGAFLMAIVSPPFFHETPPQEPHAMQSTGGAYRLNQPEHYDKQHAQANPGHHDGALRAVGHAVKAKTPTPT